MRFQFQGNGRVQAAGTPARAVIKITGAIADGRVEVLQWNGKKESIVFKTTPSAANEFPAGSGSSDYVRDTLLPYFKSYFPFREDFTATASNFGSYQGIVLEAKQPGTAYNISRVATSSLPGATASTITLETILAGADPKVRERYSAYVELWLQKLGTPGTDERHFDRIYNEFIDADETGFTEFDAGELLHGYLVADLPDFLQNTPVHCERSGRCYFIAYAEAYGSPVRPGLIKTDDIRTAYLGGADFEHRAGAGFLLEPFVQAISPSEDRALRFGGEMRYILPDQPEWLTFINTRSQSQDVVLRVRLTFDDNTGINLVDLVPAFTFSNAQKWTIGVGPLQLRLHEHVPQGRSLSEYTVRLMTAGADPNGNAFLSRQYRYIIGYQWEPYIRHFAYVNSLGAYDTLTTYGKGTRELQRVSKQAERVVPAQYEVSDAQYLDYNITLQQQYEVTTGFRSEFELRRWNDFYRSQLRYRATSYADGTVKAIQIGIISKSIEQHKDADRQFAHKFQYAELHQDEFYTPDADDADPISPLGMVTAGSPNVTYITPTVVTTVDNTVPQAARDLTPTLLQSLKQLTGEGLHSKQGYLKQAAVDELYRPKALKIDYELDLVNTPVIPEIPEVVVPDFQAVTRRGSVTDLPISTKGYILSKQPVPIQRALGIAAFSDNAPDQKALEMMYPEDLRNWLGVCRTNLEGVDTGMFAMFRKNQNGTIDIVGVKATIASVAANGYATPGPLGAGFYVHGQELARVPYVTNVVSEFYNPDIGGFVEVKIDLAQLTAIQLGVMDRTALYALIREQVLTDLATNGAGGGGGTIIPILAYYIEELRCFKEPVNGGKDYLNLPLDKAQRRAHLKALFAEVDMDVRFPEDVSDAAVEIPMQTRYSARVRQIYVDKTAAPSVEHIVFGPGEAPVLGSTINRYIAPSERISSEVFGSHSLDECAGTGTAPAYVPPVTAPAQTFTGTELWRLYDIVTTPVYKINDVYPTYEKSVGWLNGLVNAYGPNYVKLEPLSGLALTNFTDTGMYATELIDGGTGLPGTFRKIYVGPPSGDYRFSARAEGSNVWVSKTVTVARSGNAPVVASRYPDQVVDQLGDQALAAIAGTFSDADGDTLTYTVGQLDAGGNPTGTMPAGLVFNPSAAKPLTSLTSMANTSYAMYITARDPDGNSVTTKWLLTVNRRRQTSLVVNAPAAVPEGTGTQLSATAGYSDNSKETITLQGLWFMAGPDNVFRGAVVTIDGATLGTNGLYTVASDQEAGNNRTHQVICQYGGMQARASISVVDNTVVVTNRPPYINEAMPDVPIRTAARSTFALPDDHIRDPEGAALTLLVTQVDGSPLPAWLSYDYPTRTFTKAEGFSDGSCAVAVKASDPKGLFVVDDFLVVVQAEATTIKPAIDIEVVRHASGQLQINMYFRTPTSAWQRYIKMSGDANEYGWVRMSTFGPNGPTNGYYNDLYGQPQVGQTLEIRLSPDGASNIVTRSFTVTGVQARTNLYTAP